MSTVALVLNSSNVSASNNTSFRYNFIQGAFAIPEGSEVCISSIVIPYSWFNVNGSQYANNVFSYYFPVCATFTGSITLTTLTVSAMTNGTIGVGMTLSGGTVLGGTTIVNQLSGTTGGVGTYTVSVSQSATCTNGQISTLFQVTLQNGFYQVADINNALQNYMISQGQYLVSGSQNIYFISITTNANFYANQIICATLPTAIGTYTNPANMGLPGAPVTPQFVVMSSYPAFGSLIGYSPGTYPPAPSSTSFNTLSNITPNITPVNSVVVRCNLVSNQVGTPSDIMTSFPINTTFGANINFSPNYEQWVGINSGRYASLSLTLQDQNFNGIQANDVNCLITILIRSPKKEKEKEKERLISLSGKGF